MARRTAWTPPPANAMGFDDGYATPGTTQAGRLPQAATPDRTQSGVAKGHDQPRSAGGEEERPWSATTGPTSDRPARINHSRRPPALPLPKLLLTPVEAAAVIGISRTRMFAFISRGEIESVLVGRSRRIPVQALEDYVARLRAASADTTTA